MIHIDTNQSTSLQTTGGLRQINISCIYTHRALICVQVTWVNTGIFILLFFLDNDGKRLWLPSPRYTTFGVLFNSKMVHFRADSNYLANMNMAGLSRVCSTEPETACWKPQLPRPAARGSSCRWGPAAAAWAGAKGYRKTASGRSACRHSDRTWKPGSWCKG